MYVTSFLRLFFFLYVISTTFGSRKYDVEYESKKLFKEDIRTVLHRFRRTSDYLKIMQDRVAEYMMQVENMAMMTMFNYNKKLTERVKKLMTDSKNCKDGDDGKSATTASPDPRSGSNKNRRVNYLRATQEPKEHLVEILDKYKKLTSRLSLSEKNAMKNLGYMFAGEVIHAILRNLRGAFGDWSESMSTRMDNNMDDDANFEYTTQHVSVHEVTPSNVRAAASGESLRSGGAAIIGKAATQHPDKDDLGLDKEPSLQEIMQTNSPNIEFRL